MSPGFKLALTSKSNEGAGAHLVRSLWVVLGNTALLLCCCGAPVLALTQGRDHYRTAVIQLSSTRMVLCLVDVEGHNDLI